MQYNIPVMGIQDTLMSIDFKTELIKLKEWLDEKVKKEKGNWGIKGKGYFVKFDLERQWYPIFVINNRWLASAFIEYLAEVKPWKKHVKKRFVLGDGMNVFARVTKNGKIHAGNKSKGYVYFDCLPAGWDFPPINERRTKDVEIIKDISKHSEDEICKTCIKMGAILTGL